MHATIATAVAFQHQTDLLRAAEHRRQARQARAGHVGLGSPRRSAVDPCCA